MCGIVGYTGESTDESVLDVLMNGLSGLEYRGYDSAGVALTDGSLSVYKREGELAVLEEALPEQSASDGFGHRPQTLNAGIGHTRWSTHGVPSDANAHPHTDCQGQVAVVHNGIIDNYQELRSSLEASGHEFESETDTEVIPHLIEDALSRGVEPEAAFRWAIHRIDGSYAVAAVFSGSETIYAARNESPLVLGIDDTGHFLASDVPAFLEWTDKVIYLDDGEFATIGPSNVQITDEEGSEIDVTIEQIQWDADDAGKSGYDHYMLKEIYEQPTALTQCLSGRVSEVNESITVEELEGLDQPAKVQFIACGTSYHAGLYGARLLQARGIDAQVFLASEYDESRITVTDETLVVGVTQSGETADTLRGLRVANRSGATTLAMTNVVGSSAARTADHVFYIKAGPEIGVAATKTFLSQQVSLLLLTSMLTDEPSRDLVEALHDLPDEVRSVLDSSRAAAIAEEYVDSDAFFYIGRGYNVPVALEGALKMKEISYIHAEGYPAGELKHGPLALVTDRTPVFAIVTRGRHTDTMVSNVKEVSAREAPVIAVTDVPERVEPHVDALLEIPRSDERLTPILANVQLQLVAYWVANELGRSIDKPRNLAKSVTVV